MNSLKKILLLAGSVLSLSTMINAFDHTFINGTPFTVRFYAKYLSAFCKDDPGFEVGAGHSITHSVGVCSVKEVGATVYEKPGVCTSLILFREQEQNASPYHSTYHGGSSYAVFGPIIGADKNYYTVTRVVQ
jgi:hypothetical protein